MILKLGQDQARLRLQLVLDEPLDVLGHLYITFSPPSWLVSPMVFPFPIGWFNPNQALITGVNITPGYNLSPVTLW